ncbi:MAG: Eco57I restriction-modification methylase domain-containing protein, partial [Bacteroidota bacterium]
MDKKTLHKLFSYAFDDAQWKKVLQSVFGAKHGLLIQPKDITANLKGNHASKATAAFELGSFTTSDDRIIGLYKIELKPDVWLERNKVGLRELLRDVYKYDVDGAIIVFVQDKKWRLSFVSEIKRLNDEGEVIEQATEPKRYTYLLGEGEKVRTPSERLAALSNKALSIQDILNAFGVEALNEEFYKIIQAFFYQLVGGKVRKGKKQTDYGEGILQLPEVPKNNRQAYREFAVRLIGRSVFCWFLKMKKSDGGEPLLPESLLASKAVRSYPNYYSCILERIFFQTLNTPMDQRVDNLPEGAEQIPFLNGGLFEPSTDDYYKPNRLRGLSEYLNTPKIPDSWFQAFFEELEKYNFTIDENSVTDIEVSVDPEMLGRIFENLLAEIDPDSGETARKATGSFYTPREIVDYMATESLVQYLHNKTQIEPDKLRPIFKMLEAKDPKFTPAENNSILDALDKVKILDPACGSGAFPMGVLQKIVQALQKLDPEAEWWKQRQVDRISDIIAKKQRREKLESSGVEYVRKIGIIQNSLYGVDIQPVAAEISKLRCFLTLIVDENIDESKSNRGIEPLPNLEFKFVTADTLIKLPEEKNFGGLFNANDDLEQLDHIRQDYLQNYGEKKERLKKQFKVTQDKIAKEQQLHGAVDVNSRAWLISTWKPFSNDKSDWFDPKWMFGVKKFDLVIGNPPYKILTKNNTPPSILRKYLNEYAAIKESYSKNIFVPFIQMGAKSLTREGVLSFIVPEGLFETRSYRDCVKFLKEEGSVTSITTFTSLVFENATTGNLIFSFSPISGLDRIKFHFSKDYRLSIIDDKDESLIDEIDSMEGPQLKISCHLFKGMVVSDRKVVVGESKDFGENIFLLGKSMAKWRITKEFYTNYSKLKIVGGTKKKSKHDVVP